MVSESGENRSALRPSNFSTVQRRRRVLKSISVIRRSLSYETAKNFPFGLHAMADTARGNANLAISRFNIDASPSDAAPAEGEKIEISARENRNLKQVWAMLLVALVTLGSIMAGSADRGRSSWVNP